MRAKTSAVVVLLATGCASGGGGGGDGAMAYSVPAEGPVTYVRGDSLDVSVEAPGLGTIDLDFDQAMTLGVSFGRSASGVQITAEFQEFTATLNNPMSGTERADIENLSGPLIFTVDARGDANVVQAPEVTGMATQVFRAASLANELLPRLPDRAVAAGDSWADTVIYSDDTAGGSIFSEWYGTMTVTGDTIVDGATVTKVLVDADVRVDVEVDMGGMYVTQSMGGTENGFFLWDAARRLVVYQETMRAFDGTVDVDIAPELMDMVARQVVRTRIAH
jgi:hypothetical protein